MKKRELGIFILILVGLMTVTLYSQEDLTLRRVHLKSGYKTVAAILKEIEREGPIVFSYSQEIPAEKKIQLKEMSGPIKEVLMYIFPEGNVEFARNGNKILLIKRKSDKGVVFGRIFDKKTKEPVPFASVQLEGMGKGAVSDHDGYYRITGAEWDRYLLRVDMIGYGGWRGELVLDSKEKRMDVYLEEIELREKEIFIYGDKASLDSHSQLGEVHLTPRVIKALPSIGEPDVFRSLGVLPGVFPHSDLSSDYHVRGGKTDENLVLLDGFTIYNPFHLGGIFSTFDANTLRAVEFQRGEVDAEFGGRLSSILSMTTRDGKMDRIHADVMLSLISSKCLIEGPLSDKLSFMVSYRRTYLDHLAKEFPYYFHDAIGKLTYRVSDKDEVRINTFYGMDAFKRPEDKEKKDDFRLDWNNHTLGVTWKRLHSSLSFTEIRTGFSRFRFNFKLRYNNNQFTTAINHIDDYSFKIKNSFVYSEKLSFEGGVQNHYIRFHYDVSEDMKKYINYDDKDPDFTVFLQSVYQPNGKTKLKGGGRLVYSGNLKEINVEPRLSAAYSWNKDLVLKGALNYFTQSVTTLDMEVEALKVMNVWEFIKSPASSQKCLQTLGGIDYSLFNTKLSCELYHKRYFNTVERSIFPMSTIDRNLSREQGEAYGLEIMMKSERKRYFYMFSYALGWSIKKDSNDVSYYSSYDRRHSLNVNLGMNYTSSGRISLTGVLRSGNLQPFRYGKYDKYYLDNDYEDDKDVIYMNNRGRTPIYKRVDLNFYWEWENWEFFFQIMNVFNFKNRWIQWDRNVKWNDGLDSPYLPILPTFGFTYKF